MFKQRFLTLLLFCSLIPASSQAQNVWKMLKNHDYSISYLGNNGIRPGINTRTDITLRSKEKDKVSRSFFFFKKRERLHQKEWIYSKNAGFYLHPRTHLAFNRNWGVTYRKTRTRGWEFQTGFYPLGVHLFFLGETYRVSNQGEVEQNPLAASLFYSPGIDFSFGKKFKKQDRALEAWHVRLQINGLINYNNSIVPTANLELGLRFQTIKLFKNAIKKNINIFN